MAEDPDAPAPVGASGPPLAVNLEHVEQGQNARNEDYRELPRFADLLEIFLDEVQQAEDAIWQIALDSVDTAVGVQLDGFGSIVGAERQGLSDDDYRALIRATIQTNRSEGTVPDLYAIVTAALDSTAPGQAKIETYPPAGYILTIAAPPAFDVEILARLIIRGTAAGVRGIVVASDEPVGTRFEYSAAGDFPTFNAAKGFDHAAIPDTGTGRLTRAFDERI